MSHLDNEYEIKQRLYHSLFGRLIDYGDLFESSVCYTLNNYSHGFCDAADQPFGMDVQYVIKTYNRYIRYIKYMASLIVNNDLSDIDLSDYGCSLYTSIDESLFDLSDILLSQFKLTELGNYCGDDADTELVKKYLVKKYSNIMMVLWGKYPGFAVIEAIMDNFCPNWKQLLTVQFAEL